jgi:hypothetical protein
MPELFRLEKEEFSEIYQEKQWTYLLLFEFTFNKRKINKITITDHIWKKKGREKITKEFILAIFKENLNGERREPTKIHKKREVFVEERIPCGDKDYLLVFWFEDNSSDWLWVRNCYPIS